MTIEEKEIINEIIKESKVNLDARTINSQNRYRINPILAVSYDYGNIISRKDLSKAAKQFAQDYDSILFEQYINSLNDPRRI